MCIAPNPAQLRHGYRRQSYSYQAGNHRGLSRNLLDLGHTSQVVYGVHRREASLYRIPHRPAASIFVVGDRYSPHVSQIT